MAAQPAQPAPAAKPAADYEQLPSGTSKRKTLVIGLDGASLSQITEATAPTMAKLASTGLSAASNLYSTPMAQTVSGAGWSTIATGAWSDKHNVVDNSFSNPNYERYPDFMSRLEAASPRSSTLVVGTWNPIPDTIFGKATDLRVRGGNDAGTTAKAADYLKNGNPDATFVHLDDIDGAGLSAGSSSAAYAKAHTTADAQVKTLVDAIQARPSFAKEDWLIVVTADHGHKSTGGHGGTSALERQTFVIANGKGIKPQRRQDVKIVDIAPSVLEHQGLRQEQLAGMDGQTFASIEPDAFDSLAPRLGTAVDEVKIDPSLKGFSHDAPTGWSIDNTRMPAGGVTEWAGWSFTNDDFFTAAERGQGREGNVRSRNVFAVADSDEWDDKAHGAGQFDSTLISAAVKVKGAKALSIGFVSDYVVDGPQSGQVLVSFDGAAPQLVKSYTKNFNGTEALSVKVPQGAGQTRVHFRYTGTNSAFWAVDQVKIVARKQA
ncbi:alkaline phosphatase family protein [Galactobacter valiniphilus]|uniref:alkaline phosphatase family protein n=1 Tax=Galactobacter valiniphilus TaxID=2676122 RepID=UPI003736C205